MVRGIGIDVVEIVRIQKLVEKYGQQFLGKVFTDAEVAYCNAKAHPAIHFAGRWAVKEAFYKALPAAIQPIAAWKSIETLPAPTSGKPEITILTPDILEFFKFENIKSWQVSVSHERSVCTAIVLLE